MSELYDVLGGWAHGLMIDTYFWELEQEILRSGYRIRSLDPKHMSNHMNINEPMTPTQPDARLIGWENYAP